MKVAVCLSGQLRTFPNCAAGLHEFFGDADFFGAFWEEEQLEVPQEEVARLLPFRGLRFVPQPTSEELSSVKIPLRHPNKLMYYGMKMAYSTFEDKILSEKYDLIVRCRPDLLFAPNYRNLRDYASRLTKDRICFPIHYSFGGYCDQFAVGPAKLMANVFCLFDWICTDESVAVIGDEVLGSEQILKRYMDHLSIAAVHLRFSFKILRPAFVGMAYADIPKASTLFRRSTTEFGKLDPADQKAALLAETELRLQRRLQRQAAGTPDTPDLEVD